MVQGMRLKFGPRQNDWRCCFCCHVRTGTIVLGIWHLLLHVLALSVIAVVLRHPELVLEDGQLMQGPILPTPLSKVEEPLPDMSRPEPATLFASVDRMDRRQSHNYQSLNVGVVVTMCTFLITLLMVLGAVRGRPAYLMPFFCLQVFDFCIASLTAVGYLCYPPDIRRLVQQSPHLPFRRELLGLSLQCLSLLAVCSFMFMLVLKAYLIHVVWSCYKYLSLRLAAQQRTIHYIDPDSQSLLPELPDYETALCDPRFLPPAGKKYPPPPPPPPYASVALTPPYLVPAAPAPTPVPASEPTPDASASQTPADATPAPAPAPGALNPSTAPSATPQQ